MTTKKKQRPKLKWVELQKEFIITHHARERFLTRFMKNEKYFYLLKKGFISSEPRIISLIYDLSRDLTTCRKSLDESILKRLDKAQESRGYLNDTEFLGMLYSKYGYQKFTFLVDDNICFVIVPHRDSGQKTVVTCFYAKSSRHRKKKKFTKAS